MSDAIITKIDEMGGRIDELEKNISDLMTSSVPADGAGVGAGAGGGAGAAQPR